MITSGPDVITDPTIETAKNDLEDTLSNTVCVNTHFWLLKECVKYVMSSCRCLVLS
jgi:hypothetical protein